MWRLYGFGKQYCPGILGRLNTLEMKKKYFTFGVFALLLGCVEPFEFETETFEDALVVEATITNEAKQHQITLSRTSGFDEENYVLESNANVKIVDDLQNEYIFQEADPGTYISSNVFAAQKGVGYSIMITTSDGTNYRSRPEGFSGESIVEDVYAVRETNDVGGDGVFIYIDSFDDTGSSKYYRYEYEETYKIIAPNWLPYDFILTNYDPCALPVITYDLEIAPREQEERVCYDTRPSNSIIQNSTSAQSTDRIVRFPVRFIDRNDFIITHRYSIEVKQYVQSIDAFSYYQDLKDFSSTESVFSDTQPGFLGGNIEAEGDTNKRVLGFFEVVSVSKKRLFFNFETLFPNEPKPPFVVNCFIFSAPLEHQSFCAAFPSVNPCPQSLIERINLDLIAYAGINGANIGSCPGPYIVVNSKCGDCTVLGSNVVPEFWVD